MNQVSDKRQLNIPQIALDKVSYAYYEATDEEDTRKGNMPVPRAVHYALSGATLNIYPGEFVAVVGRNGSGKSTMARLMNGLLLPVEGTVIVDGISTMDEEQVWEVRSHVGMVFQNPDNQIVGSSVEEDVAFGLENLGVPREEMLTRIDWATKTVGIHDCLQAEPHTLSGGQKQRVAIAGILAMKPACIVLDEATAMLDPVGRREVMQTVRRLNQENGITIVHITHHMDEVSLCSRAILVDNGQILADCTPRELFTRPELVREAGLETPQVTRLFEQLRLRGVEVPADIITPEDALPVLKELLQSRCKADSRASLEQREERRRAQKANYQYKTGPASLEVEHLSYTYGCGTPFEKQAVLDVSVSVGDGEFLGLIGHTGCGKSTLVQHLNGLLKGDQGSVSIGGSRMDGANLKEMRKKVGLVFQYPEYQLFESTVARDIAFGIRKEKLSEEEIRQRVEDAARIVGLSTDILDNSIYDLSGGQKRRAAIAGVLVMKPGILVLDEPAAGLDPAGRDDILRFCAQLRKEHGITVILVSHSMDDVARLCDRILVMHEGRSVMLGTPEEVFEQEDYLTEIGLSVPQLTTLFHCLKEHLPEIPVSGRIYTVEDAWMRFLRSLGKEARRYDHRNRTVSSR